MQTLQQQPLGGAARFGARHDRVSEASASVREQALSDLQELMIDMQGILQQPVERWAHNFYRLVRHHEKGLERSPESYSSTLADFLKSHLPAFKEALREATTSADPGHQGSAFERATEIIHNFSEYLFKLQERRVTLSPTVHSIPLETLQEMLPRDVEVSKDRITVRGHEFPRPQSNELCHKGGLPRVLLKLLAGAPEHTIRTELPANDLDVIAVANSREALDEAAALGISRDGIELVDELDFKSIFASRDLDLNGCVVTSDSLVYADWAHRAARDGQVAIIPATRGLYGNDFFHDQDGTLLAKNRGLARLVKSVVEGKAESFDILPRNKQVDLGIYWLILARRFEGKEHAETLMNRMFDVAKSLGQTQESDTSPIEFLSRTQERYPFFSFSDSSLDDAGVVRWLAGKLNRQTERFFRASVGIYNEINLERRDGDTVPERIQLEPIEKSPSSLTFQTKWREFVALCERRRADSHSEPAE